MRSRLQEFAILFAAQILVSLVIHEIAWIIYSSFFEQIRNNFNWGITLRLATYAFLGIAIIVSLLLVLVNKVRQMIGIIVFGYLFFALLFLNNYHYTPYRTLLLLFSVFLGMMTAFFIKNHLCKGKVTDIK